MTDYKICKRCIMDTSDREITFDKDGICSHCQKFESIIKPLWSLQDDRMKKLTSIVEKIKQENANNRYDCIVGLSGGVDSSYLAYVGRKMGLRLLAVHVDTGWNSELAVKNIENICKKLEIDLYTHVVDWNEMRDLQLSYFKSGVANQDVPQDHAIFSALYKYAVKNKIRYVLHGSNFATESVLPESWGYNAMDKRNLIAIQKKFGTMKLKKFPMTNFFEYYFYYPFIRGMKVVKPLNYMDYNKERVIELLKSELDWQYYGGKHHESKFTKFFQSYYLPTRFGYDKRRAHLSSLILSGMLTREEALVEINTPSYDEKNINENFEYVSKKLGLAVEDFKTIMNQPLKRYSDYPNNEKLHAKLSNLRRYIKK